jgi:hypothetical protein
MFPFTYVHFCSKGILDEQVCVQLKSQAEGVSSIIEVMGEIS